MRIEIPLRTVSEANARCHWAQKAKRVKMQRQAVTIGFTAANMLCTCGCGLLRTLTPGVNVTLTRIAPRELDDDNLARSFKAIRDQVAVHLGVDDRSKLVTWRYAQEKGKPREYAVRIEVAS